MCVLSFSNGVLTGIAYIKT